jgi:hypothetical protein
MPVGSAASLPQPQVPLHPSSFVRPRERRFLRVPHTAGTIAPLRFLPCTVDDPPRGRVLLATTNAPAALEIQRMLRDVGYRLVGPATSVKEVERLLKRTASGRRIDCAVVDLGLCEASAVAELMAVERIPLVFLASPLNDTAQGDGPVVHMPCDPKTLVTAIDTATRRNRPYPVPPPQPVWPRVFPQL